MKRTAKTIIALAVLAVMALIGYDIACSDHETVSKSDIAMGTVVTYKLYDGTEDDLKILSDAVKKLENTISWHIDSSAVSTLNKKFKVTDSTVSRIAADCLSVYNTSDGAFDVSVGAVSSLWDIGGDNARVPGEGEIKAALKKVDGSLMKIDGEKVQIGEGQFVDLGAVGKGYACDVAYGLLKSTLSAKGAAVSVGGSVVLYGQHNRLGDRWRVAVKDPFSDEKYAGVIELDDGFVSTSGDYERTLTVDGVTYHHIIDPSTGYPSDSGLSSVTVVAESGVMSDALSTACFVLGYEKSLPVLEFYDAQAVFIDKDRNIYITDGLKSSFIKESKEFTVIDNNEK